MAITSRLNRSALWNNPVIICIPLCAAPNLLLVGDAAKPDWSYVAVMSINPSPTNLSYACLSVLDIPLNRFIDGK